MSTIRIYINFRVSVSYGNLNIPPDNQGYGTNKLKRKCGMSIFGQVVFSVAPNTWGLSFMMGPPKTMCQGN